MILLLWLFLLWLVGVIIEGVMYWWNWYVITIHDCNWCSCRPTIFMNRWTLVNDNNPTSLNHNEIGRVRYENASRTGVRNLPTIEHPKFNRLQPLQDAIVHIVWYKGQRCGFVTFSCMGESLIKHQFWYIFLYPT